MTRYDPDAQRRTETAVRGRDFIIGACDDDTEIVSVFGQLLAPAAAVLKQRVAAMVNGLCADDPRSAGERRSDAAGAIADGNDVLACRCGSPDCPTAGVTPKSDVVIRVIADQSRHQPRHRRTARHEPATEEPRHRRTRRRRGTRRHRRPGCARLRRRCCWDTVCCPTRCWPRRSATGRPSSRSAPPASSPSRGIGPATSWPSSSGCAICSAASPAATSPPIAATSTTPGPGPAGPPMPSNLNCKCRHHHLMKTFWIGVGGWSDQQLPDGTLIWTAPSGATFTTHPGSRLLFPTWNVTTAELPATRNEPTTRRAIPRADDAAPKTHPRRRHRRSNPSRTRTQRTRHPTLLRFSGPLCTRSCAACIELCRQGRRATCCRG